MGGVGVAARVDGGRGVPGSCLLHSLLVAPFAVRAHRVIPGSSERRGGIRVTRFGGPERKRVFVCRHPRSCPESPKTTATVAAGFEPYGVAVGSLPIAHPTASTVSCSPGTLAVGQPTKCTVTITDTASRGQTTPTGTVSFASIGAGSFSGAGSCTLSGSGASASCQVAYTPSATGTPLRSDTITTTYGGDPTHTNSSGSTTVRVQPTSKQDCMDGRYHNYGFPNQGQCIKYVNHGG